MEQLLPESPSESTLTTIWTRPNLGGTPLGDIGPIFNNKGHLHNTEGFKIPDRLLHTHLPKKQEAPKYDPESSSSESTLTTINRYPETRGFSRYLVGLIPNNKGHIRNTAVLKDTAQVESQRHFEEGLDRKIVA